MCTLLGHYESFKSDGDRKDLNLTTLAYISIISSEFYLYNLFWGKKRKRNLRKIEGFSSNATIFLLEVTLCNNVNAEQ